ncbi:MAG: hypothetical protein AAGU19_19735 [Prolixibacteraceae bacterium]
MKTTIVTLAFFFTCCFCFSQNVTGVFKTDFNELTITQNGSHVTGTYKHQNGRIEGTLSGRTITGMWYQSNGKGKFVFEFFADYSGFTGKWGYNDAEPNSQWNGTRIGGVQPPPQGTVEVILGVYSSDFNELTMSRKGNQVTGTYKHRNGRVEGTLNGNTVTGMWYQDNGKGRFIFEFNSDFSRFTGKWGYNDAEPNSQWNGTRIAGSAVGMSEKPAAKTQPVKTTGASSGITASPAVPGVTEKLNVQLANTKAVAGDLKVNGIRLSIPDKAFDQKVNLQVKETAAAPQFDKKKANLIGQPFEITIDQTTKRLNKPVTVQVKVSAQELAGLEHRGDLWMGYYNGKGWDYFKPREVNTGEGYVSFTTFHFSLFAKAAPTKAERVSDFAYKTAVTQWVEEDNNQLTRQATEQMVEQILKKKMGLENKSLAQDVVEAIMNENDYTKLLVSLNDDRMDDFSQDLAVLAGQKICDVVTSESNAKELLGTITDHSSKIGTGVQMATALSEGDLEGAAKALSAEIISSYPVAVAFQKAAEITERQINRWRDEELEAAYQVFVKGAESGVSWWGYQVEAGKFDQVWEQMRGLEAKLMDDAIKQEAARQKIDVNKLGDVWLDKIRRDTKENFRQEFMKRKSQEARIETIKADNEKLIREFEQANLLARDRFGFTDATTFDFRLERLFRIKDMVLKDTKSKLGFTGINGGGVVSSATVAHLIQLWYSENGKEKYRQELVRLGYKKEEKKLAAVEAKPQAKAAGGELEGVWVGSITHTPMRNYWGDPEFEWLAGVNSRPILILLYQAGERYRGLYLDLLDGLETLSYNTPGILSTFKNGSMEYRKPVSDGHMDTVYRIWKATRLKTPVSPAIFPENVSLPSLEKASAEYIEATGKKDEIDQEGTIEALKGQARQKIQRIKVFYDQTPAFQRAAEIWLKERKFKMDRPVPEQNDNFDRAAFEKLFNTQLDAAPTKK